MFGRYERAFGTLIILIFVGFYLAVSGGPQHEGHRVNPKQDAAERIGGKEESGERPASHKDNASKPENSSGHAEDNQEIYGIKKGEGLLILATFGLWYATWRLVRGAEITAERQLRAYVSIGTARIARNIAPDIKPVIRAELMNFGQTPAYKVCRKIDFIVAERPPEQALIITRLSNHVIGPNAPMTLTCEMDQPLTQIQFDLIVGGSLNLYWAARVEYIDAFKKPRATNLVYVFTPDLATGAFSLASCESGHNEHT